MLPCSSLPSVARPKRSPGKYTAGGGKQVPFGPAGVSVISFLGIARLLYYIALTIGVSSITNQAGPFVDLDRPTVMRFPSAR